MLTVKELKATLSSDLPLDKKLSFADQHLLYQEASASKFQEIIIVWLVETCISCDDDSPLNILNKNLDRFRSESFRSLSKTSIQALLKYVSHLRDEKELSTAKLNIIDLVLSTSCVSSYLKQHSREATQLFQSVLLHLVEGNDKHLSIFSSFTALYQHISTQEKVVISFIKRCIPEMAKFYAKTAKMESSRIMAPFIQFVKIVIFGKDGALSFSSFLQSFFISSERKNAKFEQLFAEISKLLQSDQKTIEKTSIVKLILETVLLIEQTDDTSLVKLVIVIAHLLRIEQIVLVKQDDTKKPLVIINLSFLQDDEVNNLTDNQRITIWNEVIGIISERSVNLNSDIEGCTGLQWFQAWLAKLLSEPLTRLHVENLTKLALLDFSIIEVTVSRILRSIFSNSSFFTDTDNRQPYEAFILASLNASSRLQRSQKFLAKFIPATAHADTDVDPQLILPQSFLDSVSFIATTLPSTHCLDLLTTLLDNLEQCVNSFEENKMKATCLHTISSLMTAVLKGCRLLYYSLPRNVIDNFILLIQRLKDILARFGTLILLRPHVRSTMQSFLQICLICGEIITLVNCYFTNDIAPPPKDSEPTDLSSSLSFISRDQWSVFAGRIANFGDQKCNGLLLKLIAQKLRVSRLHGDKSLINADATAKYLLSKLLSNDHGIDVFQIMGAEELSLMLDALSENEAKPLVSKMFEELTVSDEHSLERWIGDTSLLENGKFISLIYKVAIANLLLSRLDSESRPVHKQLIERLISLADSLSPDDVVELRDILNGSFSDFSIHHNMRQVSDKEAKIIWTLKSLPFAHLSSKYGSICLSIITGVMVVCNLTEELITVFERFLSLCPDISQCFDAGLCIMFLAKKVPEPDVRAQLIESLVVKSTTTTEGTLSFQQLVTSLKKDKNLMGMERLQTRIHIYNAIRKCWGRSRKSVETGDILAKQRKRLIKGIRGALKTEDQNPKDFVLLDAYAIELLLMERKGKIASIANMNFRSYLDLAISGIKDTTESDHGKESCIYFLNTVLKCAPSLRSTLQDEFVYKIWSELKSCNCLPLWHQIPAAATSKEFTKIVDDIKEMINNSLCSPSLEPKEWNNHVILPKSLRPLFVNDEPSKPSDWNDSAVNIWMILLSKANKKQQTICQNALKALVENSRKLLPKSGEDGLLSWLRFLHFCSLNNSVKLTSAMYDFMLEVILESPEENVNFLHHFTVRIEILCSLCGPRGTFFTEKIALIFQAFRRLLDWIARESDTSLQLPADLVSQRALAAFHFEKLTGALVKKELGKEVAFFIAEIMRCLTTVTLLPSVKMHLNNGVFNLLNLANEHTVQFLMRSLPAGSQQLFTILHGQYGRFYKFKGKI